MLRWSCLGLLLGLVACATPLASPGTEPTQAYAWLNRLTWGANSSLVEGISASSYGAYLEGQLHPGPERLPEPVQQQIESLTISQRPFVQLVQDVEQRRKDAGALPTDEERRAAQQKVQAEVNRLMREAETRHILRALYSPNQIQVQMSWFWMNHFNINQHKVALFLGDMEESVVRPRALGKFRDLLAGVVYHPAMLRYLDNERNAVKQLNENFARELMELHTLGVNGGYSQGDVQELARILTGAGINLQSTDPVLKPDMKPYYVRRSLFEFNPLRHDFGDKVFLGQPIKGKALTEMDEVIDRLAHHPSTARFVSRKMALFWLSEEPSAALLERMSQTFTRSDGDIAQTLATLLNSDEFHKASGRAFKDPMRYVLSALRLAYDEQYIVNVAPILSWLNRMGEPLFARATPDGYPLNRSAWDGPGQMTVRFEVAKAIGSGNAGMFKTDGPPPMERTGFAQLSNAVYFSAIRKTLRPATRQALQQSSSVAEWNTLLLASPEMMLR